MRILITGVAGFIGFNLAKALINEKKIVGIDNLNSYYSKKLKLDRLKILKNKNFIFYKLDIVKKKNSLVLLKNTQ